MHAVDAELVVKMGAGRDSGRPHVRDELPLLHPFPLSDPLRIAGQVRVQRRVAVSMGQHDGLAIAALATYEGYAAASGRPDGRAAGSGIVDAPVGPPDPQDGVQAGFRESGADAVEPQRIAHERAPQRPALGSEVVGVAVRVGVAKGANRLPGALRPELESQDVTGPEPASVDVQLFVEQRERVSSPEVAREIDVPAQHGYELVDDLVRHAVGRGEERALDHPVLDRDVPVEVTGHHPGREPVPGPRELHGGELVHLVMEPGNPAVRIAPERDGLSGAKTLQHLPVATAREEMLEIRLGKPVSIEYPVKGVTVADVQPLHALLRPRCILTCLPGRDGGGERGFRTCRPRREARVRIFGEPSRALIPGSPDGSSPSIRDGRARGITVRQRGRRPQDGSD